MSVKGAKYSYHLRHSRLRIRAVTLDMDIFTLPTTANEAETGFLERIISCHFIVHQTSVGLHRSMPVALQPTSASNEQGSAFA